MTHTDSIPHESSHVRVIQRWYLAIWWHNICTWPYGGICQAKPFPAHNMWTWCQSLEVLGVRMNSQGNSEQQRPHLLLIFVHFPHLLLIFVYYPHLLQWGRNPLLLWETVFPWQSFHRPFFWKISWEYQTRLVDEWGTIMQASIKTNIVSITFTVHKLYFAGHLYNVTGCSFSICHIQCTCASVPNSSFTSHFKFSNAHNFLSQTGTY